MLIKLFLSTLAVASVALAQSTKACSADSNQVNSEGDVKLIASCETIEGDIVVGESLTELRLSVQVIKGNFIATDAVALTTINLPSLREINGDFKLQGCTTLRELSAPQLHKVGSITWITLPILQSFVFTKGISEAAMVKISDTQLNSLEGLNLQTVKQLDIDSNRYLTNVTMDLKNISQGLSISSNAKNIYISFPELVWSNNISVIGAGAISFDTLEHINGSLNIRNTTVEQVTCSKLNTIDGTLAFIGNTKLTKLDFPELEEVGGGFKIHNNTELKEVTGFPKLKQVRGAIDFVGYFTNVTLPSLGDVQGGFNLQSTEELDCSEFQLDKDNGVIKGDSYTCKAKESNPTTLDDAPGADGGSNGSGSGSGNKGAAGRVAVSSLLGLSIAVLALVY